MEDIYDVWFCLVFTQMAGIKTDKGFQWKKGKQMDGYSLMIIMNGKMNMKNNQNNI